MNVHLAGLSLKNRSTGTNGKDFQKFQVQGFKQYVDQFAKHNLDSQGEPYKVVYEQPNDRWEVAVTVSERGFQQVSFANSIATTKVCIISDSTLQLFVPWLICAFMQVPITDRKT